HASVLEFEPDEGYAIVGARASTGGVSALSAAGFEPNAGQFTGATATMHGTRTLWADGDPVFSSLRAWAGGTRTLWADGTFQPVPENTAVLRFAGLSTAQTLAPRLGSGVKVAVIDTGVDLNHPAFQGALAPAGEWWDFSANDAVPQEEGPGGRGYGHGTAVA
ncbi:S8 family serine peptidase, partial [Deinococcus pimensis]|uniref:S8 family serine peptidase n=1 Tax=Deinococcus pimensis TaxID=309888 RepID=UPI001B7FD931